MDRKKASLIVSVVGVIIMILSQITISYSKAEETLNENYVKENLKVIVKKCYLNTDCKKGKITITKLKENNYINDTFKEHLVNYSDDSYIMYPSLDIVLINK